MHRVSWYREQEQHRGAGSPDQLLPVQVLCASNVFEPVGSHHSNYFEGEILYLGMGTVKAANLDVVPALSLGRLMRKDNLFSLSVGL